MRPSSARNSARRPSISADALPSSARSPATSRHGACTQKAYAIWRRLLNRTELAGFGSTKHALLHRENLNFGLESNFKLRRFAKSTCTWNIIKTPTNITIMSTAARRTALRIAFFSSWKVSFRTAGSSWAPLGGPCLYPSSLTLVLVWLLWRSPPPSLSGVRALRRLPRDRGGLPACSSCAGPPLQRKACHTGVQGLCGPNLMDAKDPW